jgi:hypothetical protein
MMKQKEYDACDAFIDKVATTLPEMARTEDLIRIGIFRTAQSASRARKINDSPPFIKINNKVYLYPRDGVVKFLKNRNGKVT